MSNTTVTMSIEEYNELVDYKRQLKELRESLPNVFIMEEHSVWYAKGLCEERTMKILVNGEQEVKNNLSMAKSHQEAEIRSYQQRLDLLEKELIRHKDYIKDMKQINLPAFGRGRKIKDIL